VLAIVLVAGCDVDTPLKEIGDAQHLAADLSVQFAKALDASNLAVMAGTDEASKTYAGEARERTAAAQKDIEALRTILQRRDFADELKLLDEFRQRFDEYRTVDRNILDLAVENTNLKAQGLLFGASQEAVDALATSLAALQPGQDSKEGWQIKALAAGVLSSAREIQALQAPHIAEPDDEAMARIESRMTAAETAARRDLSTLKSHVRPAAAAHVTAATAALDRLIDVNRQIVHLSRRNSNVRSVALSLNQKRSIVSACEEKLQALRTALSKRGFVGTR
jgi:hypothetical protein